VRRQSTFDLDKLTILAGVESPQKMLLSHFSEHPIYSHTMMSPSDETF